VRLGLVGSGTIATLALDTLAGALTAPMEALIVHARSPSAARAADWARAYAGRVARDVVVTSDIDALVAARPDLVAEAAGHAALADIGPAVLAAGIDLVICSVGALSDDTLKQGLEAAAARSGARLILSPGAVGGLDLLAAARLSGLASVTYTSRKPPAAWKGTDAETRVDLASIRSETAFFEGSARDAARLYPQNANVAATIALAGVGLDRTRVRLVADPSVSRNVHEIAFASGCVDATIRIEGRPAPGNPKTSATTGYALAQMLLDRLAGTC
jgi:aspartate dehydrogenase